MYYYLDAFNSTKNSPYLGNTGERSETRDSLNSFSSASNTGQEAVSTKILVFTGVTVLTSLRGQVYGLSFRKMWRRLTLSQRGARRRTQVWST